MRKLLLIVRFGGELYYTKERGLRTGDKPTLVSILDELKTENTVNRQARSKLQTSSTSPLSHFNKVIGHYSQEIDAIWANILHRELGFIDIRGKFKLKPCIVNS